ncbi:hypothetical protein ABZ905_37015 [Streptomyces parvus]|uniref:hypothetical protein n=1 Tax=Streptomyces parvus TaxID=66428 RepID=UPI00340C2460
MAFYLVTDGRQNQYGEADQFVVRASGTRQAITHAPVIDAKNAEVIKLDDGRDVPHGLILASLVDDYTPAVQPLEEIETESAEVVSVTPVAEAPRYSVI